MARKENVQSNGIVFGNWKLYPLDDRNWELCRNTGDGRWRPLGRFYSYNTFHLALRYAADVELKDGCRDAAMAIEDALRSYEHILSGFSAGMAEAMRGRAGA